MEVAVALPEAPRYRKLISETGDALQSLGIGLFAVAADGSVEQLVRTAYERNERFSWKPDDIEVEDGRASSHLTVALIGRECLGHVQPATRDVVP